MKEKNKSMNFIDAIKWMYNYGLLYKKLLYIGVITSIIFIISNLFKAFYTKEIINNAIGGDYNQLVKYIIIFIFIITISIISDYISKLSIGNYALHTTKNIKESIAYHLTKIKLKDSKNINKGDVVSRLNNDTEYVTNVLKNDFVNIGVQPIMGLVALAYILYLNVELALVSLITVPILMIISKLLNNKMRTLFSKNYLYLGEASSFTEESILGIDLIKSYNLENVMYDNVDKIQKKNFRTEFNVFKYLAPLQAVGLSLAWTPRLVAALYGGHMALNGDIKVGTLVVIIQLLDYLAYPTAGFSWILTSINRAIGAINRINEVLTLDEENSDGVILIPNNSCFPISFNNVSFKYDDDTKVLNNVSFNVEKNKLTALVGVSGSGKSTIINLISGFYEDKGIINIFGEEVNNLNLKSLRDNISVISQDTHLFPGTILENILYGNTNASYEDVIKATVASYAHEFITKLPDGYKTLIGENGVNLSGGEAQRISIARGFLKDTPIILLDESTANLDNYSESLVQKSLNELIKGKTALVIAHRLSTIINADKILVLKSGKIVEEGKHEELLKNESYYYKLYNSYTNENKEEKLYA